MLPIETPLDIQHPEEPTVEELMLDVAESIKSKDATIATQKEQLLSVKTLLQGIVNEHKRTITPIETTQRETDEVSTRTHGEAQC